MFRKYVLAITTSLLFMVLVGCGSPGVPDSSDPAIGREMLRTTLDAWKQGDSHDMYHQKRPSITVVEPVWKNGATLVEYDLASDSTPDGYDVQFKAKLVIKDANGKQSTQKAVYNVSTTPAQVIVRAAQ